MSAESVDGALQLERAQPAVDLFEDYRMMGKNVWWLVLRGLRLNAFKEDGTREMSSYTYSLSLEVGWDVKDHKNLLNYWQSHGAASPEAGNSPYLEFEKGLQAGLQEAFYGTPAAVLQKCALKLDVRGTGIRYVMEGTGDKATEGKEFEKHLKARWKDWVQLKRQARMKAEVMPSEWARETNPDTNPENKEHTLTFYTKPDRCRQSEHVVSPGKYFVMPWVESVAATRPLSVSVTMVQCLTNKCNDEEEVSGQKATRAITETATIQYQSSKHVVEAISGARINEYNKMVPPMTAHVPEPQEDNTWWFAGARGLQPYSGDSTVNEEKRNPTTRPFVAMCLGALAQRVAPARSHVRAHAAAMRHREHALFLWRERRYERVPRGRGECSQCARARTGQVGDAQCQTSLARSMKTPGASEAAVDQAMERPMIGSAADDAVVKEVDEAADGDDVKKEKRENEAADGADADVDGGVDPSRRPERRSSHAPLHATRRHVSRVATQELERVNAELERFGQVPSTVGVARCCCCRCCYPCRRSSSESGKRRVFDGVHVFESQYLAGRGGRRGGRRVRRASRAHARRDRDAARARRVH